MSTSYHISKVFETIPKIIDAVPTTLMLTFVSLLIGLLLGMIIMLMKTHKSKILNGIASVYIFIMRATPPLIQIFLVYYGLPVIMACMGININGWDKIYFAIAALSLNAAAYLSEVLRSAFMAVPKGQYDAAKSISMTSGQMYRRIIIPQAIKPLLPGLCNYAVILLKDTSMVCLIGVIDLMGRTNNYISATYGLSRLECLTAAALLYWIISQIMEIITSFAEKKSGMKIAANGWEREGQRNHV